MKQRIGSWKIIILFLNLLTMLYYILHFVFALLHFLAFRFFSEPWRLGTLVVVTGITLAFESQTAARPYAVRNGIWPRHTTPSDTVTA